MKKVRWVSGTVGTALVAATFALPGAGVAYASGNGNVTGSGNVSLLSGNTVTAPISAPVNLCGVSLGVLGFANSGCAGGASTDVSSPSGGGAGNGNVTGDGNVSTSSGNTISAPVSAPVNICGISVAEAGFANSHCAGGARTRVTEPSGTSGPGNGNVTGDGNVSTSSGNTISAPVSAPVNICGVSLALLGFANSACQGGSLINPPTPPSCQDNDCLPPSCEGDLCTPPPSCHGDQCTPPPSCQGNCTPPTVPTPPTGPPAGPGAPPHGTVPTGPGVTTVTSATMSSSTLPTTGADLLLLGAAALGSIGAGAGTVALARRRRNGEAA